MSIKMLSFTMGLCLGVAGATASYAGTPLSTGTNFLKVALVGDIDGDGDNKGYNHFPMNRKATGNRVFIFDPNYDAWAIYNESGHRVDTGKASGGRLYCPDIKRGCKTIVGTFKVISKGGAGCVSHVFPVGHGGAPMPYCMLFDKKGYAIHGSYELPNYNASHGCIRITPTVAKWLNQNFIQIGTTVIVLPYHK